MVQSDARIKYVSSVENVPGKQLKISAATIDMLYSNGYQLLFKGISGIYRTVVPDVPTISKTITFNFAACTDDCYNNLVSNCSTFGGLCSWDEMMQYVTTPGVKGIIPMGWHIPTPAEWTALSICLGGDSIAGGKMKHSVRCLRN